MTISSEVIIMGLIKAFTGAMGGTLADQWKEFCNIYLDNVDVTIEGGVEVSLQGGVLHCGGVDTVVYTLAGEPVYSGNGDVELASGTYIVVANGHATKVLVK